MTKTGKKIDEDHVLDFHAKHEAKQELLMQRILTDKELMDKKDIFELYRKFYLVLTDYFIDSGVRHTMQVDPTGMTEGAYKTLE